MARIDELIEQLRLLEEEVQAEYTKRRADFAFVVDGKRMRFSEEVAALQRRSKTGLVRYVTHAPLLSWLAAPVIYAGWVPLALLDLFLWVYQGVCFPAYRIEKVRRGDYVVLDRGDLPYLNALEKFNCLYCGYANGLIGYAREIAARTEQFFCPIKHARRVVAAHDRYPGFFEYGDAESFRLGLERLRAALAVSEPACVAEAADCPDPLGVVEAADCADPLGVVEAADCPDQPEP
jgi:hypothetical protein